MARLPAEIANALDARGVRAAGDGAWHRSGVRPSRERSTAQANLFIGGTYVRERVKRLRIPGPALGVSAAPRSELTR